MDPFHIHPDVQAALTSGRPVVALESTIISHGLPYPQNLEMANTVARIIKEGGATPATIAVIDGVVKIGLNENELKVLATAQDVMKLSKRDIPYAIAQKRHGATTVSATMVFAHKAGISVFATGGIGGVHRDAQNTFDISRDLEELSQTNVAVVCAGAKSILDLPKTLEYLETKGVPVIGYATDKLPAFYTRSSPYDVDYNLSSPQAIAQMMQAKWSLGLEGGLVVANPIPSEASMDPSYIDSIIAAAITKANKQGIKGKAMTPFLLEEVKNATKGASLDANLALVYNNARLGVKIAKAYSDIT